MERSELHYFRSLVAVAPKVDLASALWRRMVRPARRFAASPVDGAARTAAAAALVQAPRLLACAPAERHRQLFPQAEGRLRQRARRILDGEVEIFGRFVPVGARIDWQREPLSGHVYPDLPTAELDLSPGGADPKYVWELGRASHLVELAAAAHLCAELSAPARAHVAAEIGSFLDGNRVGRGVHYASPLEVALRAIHWLGAIELSGGVAAFSAGFAERLGGALLADLRFLATHLEDSGVVPANHLLANWTGIFVLGLALDGAPGARQLWRRAGRALTAEAARQVGEDGAHFEASTAYHRFALELLLVARQAGRSRGAPLALDGTLARMFRFSRGILLPDGSEPGFGDGDDARLFPVVPREPRDHSYLPSLGTALFGQGRPPALPFAEEALWWLGLPAYQAWAHAQSLPEPESVSFPTGGVHILRAPRLCVALRSGPYGQKGIGGHAHNDQLALVVHADGRPLIVDPGTGCYTRDPLVRDRFRGTAAHATVVVGGAEQSPILDGRLFALLDRAPARPVKLEEAHAWVRLSASHEGYRRLPGRIRHERSLLLLREPPLLLIEDCLSGRGTVPVAIRFPLAGAARPLSAAVRARLESTSALACELELDGAVELDGPDWPAVLAPFRTSDARLIPVLGHASYSPRYGAVEPRGLVTFHGMLTLPATTRMALVVLS